MANDRLVICCDNCGVVAYLTKYYPSCDIDLSPQALQKLADFIVEHQKCHPCIGQVCLGPDSGFSILTEGGMQERGIVGTDRRFGMYPERVKPVPSRPWSEGATPKAVITEAVGAAARKKP